MPGVVLRDVAGQLLIEDFSSCIGRYLQRTQTRFDHAEEIQAALGLREFPAVAGEFEEWVIARAWMTGDGPRAIFADAVGWLRQRGVLLPGVTTLARAVARARADGDMRLWETLGGVPSGAQELVLESVLEVAGVSRVSDLERLRKGPADPTGKNLKLALRRVAELHELGIDPEHVRALVPARRLVELARYGLAAKAARLRRHPPARRTATLLATVVHLQASSIDDCLELFDLLMVTDLVGKASRETAKRRARQHPRLARASVKLAAAVKKLLEASSAGEPIRVEDLRREIEQVVDRGELRAAVETVSELVPHVDQDDEGDARARLSERIRMVSVFLRELCETVELGSNPEGEPVLREMRRMRWLLDRRKLTASDINDGLVRRSWRRLVYGQPPNGDGTVDGNAYVFCVLTQFHRQLLRRDIYAPGSTRWRDPRALLLSGEAWARAKDPVLTALGLPERPDQHLAQLAATLDGAYRDVAGRLAEDAQLTLDDDGRLHVSALQAIPDPPSLLALRRLVGTMLPRVGLPEVVLEVMSWLPGFVAAFQAVSGARSRLEDLHVTVAACLCVQAMNLDFDAIAKPGVPALERHRMGHVDQNYMGVENYRAANPHLIEHQAGIPFAQALGGGMVVGIDGMRFVVPVPSIYARPNRKYFGADRGVTYLNMISDQAVGLAGKVVAGAPKDSLHMLDVAFSQDQGQRPDILIADTGTYSDLIFGLSAARRRVPPGARGHARPTRLADRPYGGLRTARRARPRTDPAREDPAPLGGHGPDRRLDLHRRRSRLRHHQDAPARREPNPARRSDPALRADLQKPALLTYLADEPYRRAIKAVRNLQEGRHSLGRWVFHGNKGELYQRYHDGMEDQLGALGLVINCIVLWNTVYMNAALCELRAQRHPVLDEDVRRLHPFRRRHLAVTGDYSFLLPQLEGKLRELRDPARHPDDHDEDDNDDDR